jgi:hypothetical protein
MLHFIHSIKGKKTKKSTKEKMNPNQKCICITLLILFCLMIMMIGISLFVYLFCFQQQEQKNKKKNEIAFGESSSNSSSSSNSNDSVQNSSLWIMKYEKKKPNEKEKEKDFISYGLGTGGNVTVNFNEPIVFQWNMDLTDASNIEESSIQYILHPYYNCSSNTDPAIESCTKGNDYKIPRPNANLTITGTGLITYRFTTTEDELGITDPGIYYFSLESILPNEAPSGTTTIGPNAPDVEFKNKTVAAFTNIQSMITTESKKPRGVISWVQYIDSSSDLSTYCYTLDLLDSTQWYFEPSTNSMDYQTLGYEAKDTTKDTIGYDANNHVRTVISFDNSGRSMTVRFVPQDGTTVTSPNSWLSSLSNVDENSKLIDFQEQLCAINYSSNLMTKVFIDRSSQYACSVSGGSTSGSCYRLLFALVTTQPLTISSDRNALPNQNIGSDFLRLTTKRYSSAEGCLNTPLFTSYTAIIYQYQYAIDDTLVILDLTNKVKVLSCTNHTTPTVGSSGSSSSTCPYVVDACKNGTITPISDPLCSNENFISNPFQSDTSCSGAIVTIEIDFFSISLNSISENEKNEIIKALNRFPQNGLFCLQFLTGDLSSKQTHNSNYTDYTVSFNKTSEQYVFSKKFNIFLPPQKHLFKIGCYMSRYQNGPFDYNVAFAGSDKMTVTIGGPTPSNFVVEYPSTST